jgi:hypothetical protein
MYPTLVLKNQFGETSNNFIEGGSGQLNCNFVVDSTNGNGLGVRSVKGVGIKNVFMYTSATPDPSNPNPATGLILVQLLEGYNGYQGGSFGFNTPVSGTPINVTTGLTPGLAYIITSVGTSTAANWQALGLPVGVTPAIGASFICTSATVGVGTGVVEVPKATGAGIDLIDVIGDPNASSLPTNGSGAWILCRCLAGSTLAATAPADGTVIGLTFTMLNAPGPLI